MRKQPNPSPPSVVSGEEMRDGGPCASLGDGGGAVGAISEPGRCALTHMSASVRHSPMRAKPAVCEYRCMLSRQSSSGR